MANNIHSGMGEGLGMWGVRGSTDCGSFSGALDFGIHMWYTQRASNNTGRVGGRRRQGYAGDDDKQDDLTSRPKCEHLWRRCNKRTHNTHWARHTAELKGDIRCARPTSASSASS